MASTALAVMLGCSVEDPKLAQEMLPLLFVREYSTLSGAVCNRVALSCRSNRFSFSAQMLFAGFFVAPSLIPAFLRWAMYLCSLTYGVRILMINEFHNCGGSVTGPDSAACNQLLMNVEAEPTEEWWYWIVLIVIFVVFRIMALLILRQKATRFL
jgi:hypothetical protein